MDLIHFMSSHERSRDVQFVTQSLQDDRPRPIFLLMALELKLDPWQLPKDLHLCSICSSVDLETWDGFQVSQLEDQLRHNLRRDHVGECVARVNKAQGSLFS